jgi:hypothetical protein
VEGRGRWTLQAILCAVVAGGVVPCAASAYTPPEPPWANCSGDVAALGTVIEAHRRPANNARAFAGAPLSFSSPTGVDRVPLTFTIARTQPLVPPLDGGAGTPDSTGSAVFTSSLAGAAPGTVYWSVSFSTSAIPECTGLEAWTVSAPVWSVTVLPAAQPVGGAPRQGTPARRCKVPRLHGASLAQVRRLLRRADCRLGTVTRRSAGGRTGVVRGQSPRAGSQHPAGTAVNVVLAPASGRSR